MACAHLLDDGDDVLVLPAADGAVIDVHLPGVGHVHVELDGRKALRHHVQRLAPHRPPARRPGPAGRCCAHLVPAPVIVLRGPKGAGVAIAVHAHAGRAACRPAGEHSGTPRALPLMSHRAISTPAPRPCIGQSRSWCSLLMFAGSWPMRRFLSPSSGPAPRRASTHPGPPDPRR